MLVADGVAVVKVHLHVGPELQQRRLRRLFKDRTTRWRVTAEDHWSMRHYARVERALEHCLEVTEQPCAPWHVVDGTDRQHRALEVGRTLLAGIEGRAGRRDRPALPAPAVLRRRAARVRLATDRRGERVAEEDYDRRLEDLQGRLALLSRRRRFAKHSVVAVFEGMDASGKGGAIRRITAALDARQYRVVPISAPTSEELARPYLWRFWFHLPPRGNYTIFDRSWYGRVLVERVRGLAARADWQRAYGEINEFEHELAEHGVDPRQVLAVAEPRRADRALHGAQPQSAQALQGRSRGLDQPRAVARLPGGRTGHDRADRHAPCPVGDRARQRQAPRAPRGAAQALRPDRGGARLSGRRQALGFTLALSLKRLPGSYLVLSATSRPMLPW